MSEETIGRRVTHYRLRRGLSKSQLAAFAGISRSYITRLENGAIKSPSSDKLVPLARELHITVDVLTGGALPPERENLMGWNILGGLTDEERQSVLDYAEFVRRRRRRQQEGKE